MSRKRILVLRDALVWTAHRLQHDCTSSYSKSQLLVLYCTTYVGHGRYRAVVPSMHRAVPRPVQSRLEGAVRLNPAQPSPAPAKPFDGLSAVQSCVASSTLSAITQVVVRTAITKRRLAALVVDQSVAVVVNDDFLTYSI